LTESPRGEARRGAGRPPVAFHRASRTAPTPAGTSQPDTAAPAAIGEPGCANYRGLKRPRPGRVTVLCARAKEVFVHWTSPLDDDEVPPSFCVRDCPSFRARQ
jgi:hypothetical protein